MYYVLVTGGREYDSYPDVFACLKLFRGIYGPEMRVMHGGARGADALADKACRELEIKAKAYPADWSTHGKSAGHIRNATMVGLLVKWRDLGHQVQALAFEGGKGTRRCANLLESAEIMCDYVPYEWNLR